MTFLANGHLFPVNSGHIEAKALQVLAAFADVFNVMHFDPFRAVADGAIVQQSGLSSSGEPGRGRIQISGCPFGLLNLLERLVEEMDRAAIRFSVGDVLTVFTKDFVNRRSLFVSQGFG